MPENSPSSDEPDESGRLSELSRRVDAAEQARQLESEELLTRMGAIEVLIDHLSGRIGEVAAQVAEAKSESPDDEQAREEIELRIGGLEHAADAMAPLTSVPATIAALEEELILLGRRLDATGREAEARSELVSREIEARISLAESELTVRHGEAWEGMQEVLSAESRRALASERSIEQRLADQAEAATTALADMEKRITASLEGLAGRMGSATSASGTLAESMVGRLELLERDIAEIESRFETISSRLVARGSSPGPPSTPIEAAAEEQSARPRAAAPRPA